MKRKGLLHLLCATMLLAIAIVYLPSCRNDEEGSEYWTVTLEDHYAPYQYDLEDMNMLPKSVFGMRDATQVCIRHERQWREFAFQ